jgi:hypothetical protein
VPVPRYRRSPQRLGMQGHAALSGSKNTTSPGMMLLAWHAADLQARILGGGCREGALAPFLPGGVCGGQSPPHATAHEQQRAGAVSSEAVRSDSPLLRAPAGAAGRGGAAGGGAARGGAGAGVSGGGVRGMVIGALDHVCISAVARQPASVADHVPASGRGVAYGSRACPTFDFFRVCWYNNKLTCALAFRCK